MKTDLYAYEELKLANTKNEMLFEEMRLAMKNNQEIEKPIIKAGRLIRLSLRKYLMDESLDEIKQSFIDIVKLSNLGLEGERKSDLRYLNSKFHDGLTYVEYMRVLSISYLLGYDTDDIKEYEKLVHVIKGRDILLDTLLNAMIGIEVSQDVMKTNVYSSLVGIIKEQDKEKAQDMMVKFMKEEWWKNTGKYGFRDNKNINTYTGAFAFETATIAKIKGFDLTKFEDIKYFPIDMVYYQEGKEIEVKIDNIIEKKVKVENREYEFKSYGEGQEFENGQLEEYDFSNLIIKAISFKGANLINAKFYNTRLIECNFSGCNMFGTDIQNSIIESCNFEDIEAQSISIHKTKVLNTNFEDSILLEGGMTLSEVVNNNFKNTNMYHFDLTSTVVIRNDFTDSAFGDVKKNYKLEGIEFEDNKFINADIQLTKFTEKEKQNNKF